MKAAVRDDHVWRTVVSVVGVGTLSTGVWMAFRGDVVTAAVLWSFTGFCAARLRCPAARRWMDGHQYAFLSVLVAMLVAGMAAATP